MMSALTRKLEEARRLSETYRLHKDSPDEFIRRKVHLDLDKYLMENRETAIVCIERVLDEELQDLAKREVAVSKKKRFKSWFMRGNYEV